MAEGESSPGDSEVVNIGQEKAKHPSIRTWYRVVFAGDPGVGKTSLYLRYTTGEYVESPPNIIGDANGAIKVVKLKGLCRKGWVGGCGYVWVDLGVSECGCVQCVHVCGSP